jgi:hypothetical protein
VSSRVTAKQRRRRHNTDYRFTSAKYVMTRSAPARTIRDQRLRRRALAINPARVHRSLDHQILSQPHLVGRERHSSVLCGRNIKICANAYFTDQNVRAFRDVQADFQRNASRISPDPSE